MKKRPSPNNGNPSAPDKRKFNGTENPRHLRVIMALLVSPRTRETIDRVAGASNGPELMAELRRRGLDAPLRIPVVNAIMSSVASIQTSGHEQ